MSEAGIVEARRDAGLTYLLSDAPTCFEGYLQSGAIDLIQDRLQTDLIQLNGFKRTILEKLDEVTTFGRSLSARIEERLSVR